METTNNKQFTMVYAEDVKQYGIIRATILGKIKGWCSSNTKANRYNFEGFYWSGHITIPQLSELTGLPLETVKKNLKWLLDNNIIIKGIFNKNKYDKTGWYRPNPSVLLGTTPPSSEECTHVPDRNHPSVLTGTTEQSCEEPTIPNTPTTNQTTTPSTTPTNTLPTNPSVEDLLKQVEELIRLDNFSTNEERGAAFIERNKLQKELKENGKTSNRLEVEG